jgi:hypothetical protein
VSDDNAGVIYASDGVIHASKRVDVIVKDGSLFVAFRHFPWATFRRAQTVEEYKTAISLLIDDWKRDD